MSRSRDLANLANNATGLETLTVSDITDFPTQTDNSGKFLTTNGSSASWGTVSITPTAVSDQANTSTGYLDIATGTTAQRPGSPTSGNLRYNTTKSRLEYYSGTEWVSVEIYPTYSAVGYNAITDFSTTHDLIVFTAGDGTSSYKFTPNETLTIDLLIVAAGGGNSVYKGGAGGGQVITHTGISISSGSDYYITVGAGAANADGGDSKFKHSDGSTIDYLAKGGAVGGGTNGTSGGSGSGEGSSDTAFTPGSSNKHTSHTAFSGGTINNYGNAGGNNNTASPFPSGGGGGAGAVGGDASSGQAGNGGAGIDVSATFGTTYGDSGIFGGGGGGMIRTTSGFGTGGSGGGGNGGTTSANSGQAGTANTGGGAGAQGTSGSTLAGGSGIVIIRVAK